MFKPILIAALLAMITSPARADVLVFAAASLKEPLDRMAAQFDDVIVSYGGSGTLARQISLGAPADVVLLANAAWMDVLLDEGDVAAETVTDFASNRLVVVGKSGQGTLALTPEVFADRLGDNRLAIGLTEAVPAGIYGRAALENLGLWGAVQDKLAQTDSVRAVLAMVARGQTPLGIVYQTDLRVVQGLAALAIFPETSHSPIRYVGAVVNPANAEAADFWDFVNGGQGQAILAQSGFLPAPDRSDD